MTDSADEELLHDSEERRLLGDQGLVPPGDVTLQSYERGATLYRDTPPPPLAEHTEFLDTFARLVAGGEVLELGSGTGRDALYLSRSGLRVIPTDGARSFVEMMRAQGLPAKRLDIRMGEFGGPYGGILANAVLLHLSRVYLGFFLERVSRSVALDGVLGFTLKEGDGEGWSYKKLGLPRHFTYWREHDLRELLSATGWTADLLRHVEGHHDQWLFVLASRPRNPGPRLDQVGGMGAEPTTRSPSGAVRAS